MVVQGRKGKQYLILQSLDEIKNSYDNEVIAIGDNLIEREEIIMNFKEEILSMGFSQEQTNEIMTSDIIERDNNGKIVGWGSDADYDSHAGEVQNGNGYYDSNGHYVAQKYNEED